MSPLLGVEFLRGKDVAKSGNAQKILAEDLVWKFVCSIRDSWSRCSVVRQSVWIPWDIVIGHVDGQCVPKKAGYHVYARA